MHDLCTTIPHMLHDMHDPRGGAAGKRSHEACGAPGARLGTVARARLARKRRRGGTARLGTVALGAGERSRADESRRAVTRGRGVRARLGWCSGPSGSRMQERSARERGGRGRAAGWRRWRASGSRQLRRADAECARGWAGLADRADHACRSRARSIVEGSRLVRVAAARGPGERIGGG